MLSVRQEIGRYRRLFETLTEGMVIHDNQGKIISANPSAQELLGLSLDQLVGRDSIDPRWHSINLDGKGFPGIDHPAQLALRTGKSIKQVTIGVFDPLISEYKWILVNATPIFDQDSDKPNSVYTSFTDITKQVLTERKLKEETALHQTLVEVSSAFINLSKKEISSVIQANLERVGRFVNADRIYIFKYNWENFSTTNTYEWCADGIEAQIEYLQNISMEGMEDWANSHKKGDKTYIEDVSKLDEDDQLRKTLEPQGIQSIITLPIMYQSQCLGFLGLDSVRKIHRYTDGEFDILYIFADILANVHSRIVIENNVKERIKELKSISRVTALCNDTSISTRDVLSDSVAIIQSGFYKPEKTYVKITYKGGTFLTSPFFETERQLKKTAALISGDFLYLEIYLAEGSRFLPEEDSFIETLLSNLQQSINSRENLEKIQESENRLKSLLNSQTNYVLRTNLQGRHTYWNRKFEADFGHHYRSRGLDNSDSLSSICTYDHDKAKETVMRCLAEPGKSFSVELDKPGRDGNIMTTRWEFVCLTDSNGTPYEMQCEGLDISDILKAEKELQKSEEKYRFLFEEAPEGYLVIKDGIFVECNHAAEKMIGGTREDIIGKSPSEISPEYQPDGQLSVVKAKKVVQSVLKNGGGKFEWIHVKKDGSTFLTEIKISKIEMNGQEVLFTTWKDVTETRKMQLALEKSEERFSQIAEYSGSVIWETDNTGLYTYISPVSKKVFGYEPEELIGKMYFYDLFPENFKKMFKAEGLHYLESGESLGNWENPIQRKDGSIIWVETFGTPIKGSEGNVLGYRGSDSDITDRKIAQEEITQLNYNLETRIEERTWELEKAKSEADKANKAKSEFLSRMSHELRTPMNSILGFSQLMEYTELTTIQRRNIEFIIKSGNHLLDLINEVLDISRIETGNFPITLEEVEICSLILDVTESLKPLAVSKNIQINNAINPGGECYVIANQQRLKQVFFNLINNAIKYNLADGNVTIQIQNYERIGDSQRITRILIKDTGIGITESNLKKVFQPFERGGLEGSTIEGTGLGLSVVKNLVTLMNGDYGVESLLGNGSTFWIEFSATLPPMSQNFKDESNPPKPTARSAEKILLVEDNQMNIELITELVHNINPDCELIVTKFGREALGLAVKHDPDLILLDLHLPDINGKEVLQVFKQNQQIQSTPVIIVSADASTNRIKELIGLGATEYVTKPINVNQMIHLISSYNKKGNYE